MTNSSTPIEYLKKEAKKLFRRATTGDAEALARLQRVLINSKDLSLMRVQHVLAVELGFSKWEELIATSTIQLQSIITRKQISDSRLNEKPRRTSTPLGNFFRGPGIIPTPPDLEKLADMFDNMTMEEQRRYLDEDARTRGQLNRS